MTFKQLLKEKLKDKLKDKITNEELEILPSGYQKIGDIIVVNLKPEIVKYKKEIGELVLEMYKGRVRTVCNKFGIITGEFREPQIEVIAGDENTVVTHLESGCKYRFDIRKVMFAKGNLSERTRIAKQVRSEEIIVDMFAGIGYFSVPIGVIGKPEKLYSIELNPVSFNFLKENFKINNIRNAEAINGDCKQEVEKLVDRGIRADRVLMGYLPPPKEFLDYAIKIIKKNGFLHYEDIVRVGHEKEDIERVMKDINDSASDAGFKAELVLAKKVKSYGPKTEHYVFDVRVV